MGEGRQKGGRCRCGGAPTCNVTPLVSASTITLIILGGCEFRHNISPVFKKVIDGTYIDNLIVCTSESDCLYVCLFICSSSGLSHSPRGIL